ncbi:MAG: hypothetical protein CMH78_02030 [Nitrospinae bacterium]|nr:hypothetical protein [Nitrospinota bacterium]
MNLHNTAKRQRAGSAAHEVIFCHALCLLLRTGLLKKFLKKYRISSFCFSSLIPVYIESLINKELNNIEKLVKKINYTCFT